MKNLLLIIAITFVSLVDAEENYTIEMVNVGISSFVVFCIQKYVFIQGRDGSLVQVMRAPDFGISEPTQPMRCNEYVRQNKE
tara:strand:- start:62 stop:307 length:246 start_codon:yes stop_codon:yes gene_type:complete